MVSRLSIHCSACSYSANLSSSVGRSYRLDDETEIPIPFAFAWCMHCEEVTVVEAMPSIEQIESDLAALDSLEDQTWRESFQALHRWRKQRRAPGKCLECGTTEFDRFEEFAGEDPDDWDDDYLPIRHPGCSGMLTLRPTGFSLSRVRILYTPEGDEI